MTEKDFFEIAWTDLKNENISSLKSHLNSADEIDIINLIHGLSDENQVIVYRLLTKDRALSIFEQLEVSDQENLISSFTKEAAIEAINELEPDDRVKLLEELPAVVADNLLAALSPEERAATNLLMGYEPETAGRIMTPRYISLNKDMTAEEALAKVRKQAEVKETVYTLYVVDNKRRLEGIISLRDLLIADPKQKIADIMEDEELITVTTDTDQEKVARLLQQMDLLAIPVLDKSDAIVGIITVDDAMDILEDEATEDILSKAGLAKGRGEQDRSERMIKGSLWSVWRIRLPFLFITLMGGMLAGTVIGAFEETLEALLIAAMFIPVVMGMGGNVGVQSSTIFLRGALLGHVNRKRIKRHILRETAIGLSMGVVVGTICGFVAFGFSEIGFMGSELTTGEGALLGVAVGVAMMSVMTVAATIGFFVPYMLMRLNIDQAAATDPIITTVKDIVGLLVYFGVVATFLGHLLEYYPG